MRDLWCWHFVCTKDLLDRFQFVGAMKTSSDVQEALDELVEELTTPDAPVLQHALRHTWEDIHRLLTGDRTEDCLDLSAGEYPQRLCICGGAGLNLDWQFEDIITLVRAEQLPDLSRTLERIEEPWVREELLAMQGDVRLSTGYVMSDEERSRVWSDFCSLRRFFLDAEKAGLPVVSVLEY